MFLYSLNKFNHKYQQEHFLGESYSHTLPMAASEFSRSYPNIPHGVSYVSLMATANPYMSVKGKNSRSNRLKGHRASHTFSIAIPRDPPTKHRRSQKKMRVRTQEKSRRKQAITSTVRTKRTGILKMFQMQQPGPTSSHENRIQQQQSAKQQLPHPRQQQLPHPVQLFSHPQLQQSQQQEQHPPYPFSLSSSLILDLSRQSWPATHLAPHRQHTEPLHLEHVTFFFPEVSLISTLQSGHSLNLNEFSTRFGLREYLHQPECLGWRQRWHLLASSSLLILKVCLFCRYLSLTVSGRKRQTLLVSCMISLQSCWGHLTGVSSSIFEITQELRQLQQQR